jgi:putative Holliday junction resolvase
MARFIAFDYGTRRVGIAVTDSGAMIASPEGTCSPEECEAVIRSLIASEPCAGFVVGKPGFISKRVADSSGDIERFAAQLQRTFPEIPLHFVDEDHTSREASAALVQGGMRKSRRREKGQLDRVAAAIILQRFLDTQR